MRHLILATACATAASTLLPIGGSTAFAAPEFAEGRILVKSAAGLSEAKLDKILKKAGGAAKRTLRGLNVHVVETPKGAERALANALAHNPNIAFAQVDYKYAAAAVVNDPYYGQQWHLPLMHAPEAWNYSDGTGVTVAVLDTGVYANHPDLSGKVLTGLNTVWNNTDTSDFYGHGTLVSGVIAAYANNLTGGASTAPGTKILPIRITNDGFAYSSDMAEGITWAVDHGARVANISFSGAAGDAIVASAASYMMSKGGVVVVAAANDGTDLKYSNSPYLFVAGATTSTDAIADYSNYGAYVDISAPGHNIYTTNSSGGYSMAYGTSFATPNVAAVAALVMAANPSLTPTDVLAVISNTALDLGDPGWDPYFGHGRVDALAAVELAANASTSDNTAPSVAIGSPGTDTTVNGQVTVSVQASDDFGVTSVDLYVDGRKLATETQGMNGSYLFSWDSATTTDGSHRLSAQATDAAGNIGMTNDVYVTVANVSDDIPPEVTINSPANGATVSGNVTLSGYGWDDQAMAQFKLYAGGKLMCSGVTTASCNWNTRKLPDGNYTITAQGIDVAGNSSSTSISVTIGIASTGDTTTSTNPGKGRKK